MDVIVLDILMETNRFTLRTTPSLRATAEAIIYHFKFQVTSLRRFGNFNAEAQKPIDWLIFLDSLVDYILLDTFHLGI